MTAARTDIEVDEQTIAEIEAAAEQPCEMRMHVHTAGGCRTVPCTHAAEWAMRTRCEHCGRSEVNLICQFHRNQILSPYMVRFICSGCGRPGDPVVLSVDRFRCGT